MNKLLLVGLVVVLSLNASSVDSADQGQAPVQGDTEEAPKTAEELEQEAVLLRAERDLLKTTVDRLRAELKDVKDATGATEKEKQARRAAALMAEKVTKYENKAIGTAIHAADAVAKADATADVWKQRAYGAWDIAKERGVVINNLLGQITVLEARVDVSEEIVEQLKGIRRAAGRTAGSLDRIARELHYLNW
ncbi:MAG TPA: hypothetical protein VMY42_08665 [Thermoguttaceae bacterium]|nr:hypothetical protein [Thermoguttaceae bacterium]